MYSNTNYTQPLQSKRESKKNLFYSESYKTRGARATKSFKEKLVPYERFIYIRRWKFIHSRGIITENPRREMMAG